MADAATSLLTIWMPHFTEKLHLWRIVRVVTWKLKLGLEETSLFICYSSMVALTDQVEKPTTYLVKSISGTFEDNVPQKEVMFILKSDRCTNVIICLNVCQKESRSALELARKEQHYL